MGGMLSLLMMARNSEIIAMQANGSGRSECGPSSAMGRDLCELVMFVADETIISWSNRTSEDIQRQNTGEERNNVFQGRPDLDAFPGQHRPYQEIR